MSDSKEIDVELIEIGQLYEGRSEPKRWAPITRNKRAPQPYPPTSQSWKGSDTKLWAGIASYRDSRCGKTLFNMFSKATYPDRVTAGVVQQNAQGDQSCLETYCNLMKNEGGDDCPYRENIRILEVDASEAQGPCWGRHMQSYLLADEEFCMQTDSHMDFVEGWDAFMMEEWAATKNEYGVLSTYVPDFKHLGINLNGKYEVSHLCEILFQGAQPRNQQARAIHNMKEPKLTTTWGAGYSFSKCHAERAVPYDPYLYKIFDGEEFSKMLRLWTNGYDVYTPSRSYVVHDYSHPHTTTSNSWHSNTRTGNTNSHESKKAANQRLWDLMEMPGFTEEGRREVQDGPWGLGDKRSLDQFIDFTGVNLRTKSWLGITGNRCGSGIEWVPFVLDDNEHVGDSGNLRGAEQSEDRAAVLRSSWRAREGKDPIEEGPFWKEVQGTLEASGVRAWWSPLSSALHHGEAVPREPPNSVGELAEDAGTEAASDDGEVVEDDSGLASEDDISVEDEDTALVASEEDSVGASVAMGFTGQQGEVDDWAANFGILAGDDSGSGSIMPWVTVVGLLSCVAVGWISFVRGRKRSTGSTRRKKRRRRARRHEKRYDDWSGNAFSSGAISPLGVTSFVWQDGTNLHKDRRV